ncbi:calponin homology domain protein [Talaromyces proteolyticus]|uniref:Calponin homology domain protein n=1 Tax=Talaromyces proteolyticus TaxID=1131652 RepID=A0AAD4KYV2_9EURO|nr:calponin homology domain protein [Talaromyces proteolyticus]KAH8702062.1 calponin homology domain protein [Talaromyces proteolyticus]
MASVTSLDKDLRNMRLSKYTPQAANEVRDWIEETLHQNLSPGDLLDALRDGVALCRLINLAVSPGVKYKESSMPFVQMENISHFLRACQTAPLSLPPHDVFLTVDLYERKDPAQVLQCLGAFSRRANALQPSKFPRSIGGVKSRGGVLSPQGTGSNFGAGARPRGASNVSQSSSTTFNPIARNTTPGRVSPTKTGPSPGSPPPAVSSWSKKTDEGTTAPAWNIHQYGYMGGASQGNQGVAFGARRQITSSGPTVPSLAEKEKRRREAEMEAERQQQEEELRRQHEEQRAKEEEERRWAEETARLREKERQEIEDEKIRWAEEQRKWEEDEQRRLQEEKATEERLEMERQRKRGNSDTRLNGQFLSQYQAMQKSPQPEEQSAESQRIKELEKQLELAKQRELHYEQEREDLRAKAAAEKARSRSRSRPRLVQPSYDLTSQEEERKLLRSEWSKQPSNTAKVPEQDETPPRLPSRPLPEPNAPALPARPLPDPSSYSSKENRADRFLASNPAPVQSRPVTHRPQDYSTTAEVDAENNRRAAAQEKTRAGGWASKSLLEREMERERERQREWEDKQKETADAAKRGVGVGINTQPGQGAWDVHQYGYLGGDSQNRGGPGLGVGGARRQIIGPRPPP